VRNLGALTAQIFGYDSRSVSCVVNVTSVGAAVQYMAVNMVHIAYTGAHMH